MCERCEEPAFVKAEWLDEDDDADEAMTCEWALDDKGETLCGDRATVASYDRSVDEHLCDACRQIVERELEEGLGDLLRDSGFVSASDFLPIRAEARCERCDEPARFAWVVIGPMYLCRAHAEECDSLPPE